MNFLVRSLHLWDPSGNFGQLQNQAYGYLWPMGPFHLLGDLLRLPEWVTQRLWWALLLCVAFTGIARLAIKLSIGTPASRIMAGLAFALSVRILSELGAYSVEAWPSAVAPWVLVPLAGLPAGASLRRPIAWSALAVASAGGVNGTAVFAILPLTGLWLLSLESTRRHLLAVSGWCLAVVLATAWWIGPLLLLGGYSPPFLDFIETSAVTTQVTDLQTSIRGASQWLAYLRDNFGPLWPVGHRLATEPLLIAASVGVAAAGLAGLARRGMPHRRFLITVLLIGVAMVGFGHVAAVDGAFAQWQRSLLDGVAAPLRNVHKFDVLIRLPLALGIAHLAGIFMAAAAHTPGSDRARLRMLAVTGAVVAAVGLVASPALAGGLAARGKYPEIPAHWVQATAWLEEKLGNNRVLVVPGARFGDYIWGSTGDEVIQALTGKRWGVRSAIPLAPPGTIRYLDAIESALRTGSGSPGLAEVLARAGISHLLVRSDIDYAKASTTSPMVVRQALARSPGLVPVVQFGPTLGESTPLSFLDKGFAGPVRALEVFEVRQDTHPVAVHEASAVTRVVGGPESLLDLASAGMLPPAPVVLSGDAPADFKTGQTAITDGLRRREVSFGLGRDAVSATLSASDESGNTGSAADYLPPWGNDWLTVTGYSGIAGVLASSSWADLPGLEGARPEHHPFAAMDGDPQTSWRTAQSAHPTGQWIEVRLTEPQIISEIKLSFDPGTANLPIKVTVDTGGEQAVYSGFSGSATVQFTSRLASARVRITINETLPRPTGSGGVGISEIEIPGVQASRHLVVPDPKTPGPVSNILFSAAPATPACFHSPESERTLCDPDLARGSEDGKVIARRFTLPTAGAFAPVIVARPTPGPELEKVLETSPFHAASASSSASNEPAASPAAVLDGDPTTVWWPAPGDQQPWLRMQWLGERDIEGIRLALPDQVAASRLSTVQVVGDGGVRLGVLDAHGVVKFDHPMRTDEITVWFTGVETTLSHNSYRGQPERLSIAVGELAVWPDARLPKDLDEKLTLPCGSGPQLSVGGQTRQTRLVATRRELRDLRDIPAILCGEETGRLELGAGDQELVATPGTLSVPVRAGLRAGDNKSASGESEVVVDSWGASERRLTLPAATAERILSVRENSNPGWRASVSGQVLSPLVVDGWQQGWIIPAGAGGTIVLSFTPERTFRLALLTGAGALLLVLLAAVLPGDRRTAYVPGRHRFRREGLYLFAGVALIGAGGLAGVLLAVATVVAYFAARLMAARMPERDRGQLRRAVRWLWLLPPGLFLLGAWLADGPSYGYDQAWPQLGGLAAIVTLWLSAYWPRRAGPRPPPVDGRPFDAVPADRREPESAGHGEHEQPERVTAEMRPAQLDQ